MTTILLHYHAVQTHARRSAKRRCACGLGIGRYLFVSTKQEEKLVPRHRFSSELIKKVVTMTATFRRT